MLKKDFWLKLFQENETALACAVHLCERFVTEEQLQNGADFIAQKKDELYNEVPEEQVVAVLGDKATQKPDLSHIRMLECEEQLGPYRMPKVVLFNQNKLTADEAFRFVQAGEYNDNIVVLEKRQWIALFRDGKETAQFETSPLSRKHDEAAQKYDEAIQAIVASGRADKILCSDKAQALLKSERLVREKCGG